MLAGRQGLPAAEAGREKALAEVPAEAAVRVVVVAWEVAAARAVAEAEAAAARVVPAGAVAEGECSPLQGSATWSGPHRGRNLVDRLRAWPGNKRLSGRTLAGEGRLTLVGL
jgi:hypothetical protein